jgi:hypothetical protein
MPESDAAVTHDPLDAKKKYDKNAKTDEKAVDEL